MKREVFKKLLWPLHVELLKMQRWVQAKGERVLILIEGRDAAGKGAVIKRMTKHLNPRGCRVVALPRRNGREQGEWYFQRYIRHVPTAGEIVIFDRSWYNRAGLERVFGYCERHELEAFMRGAPELENQLARDGIHLLKLYLSIDKDEQARRLAKRQANPLKRWKLSALDLQAQERWDDYTRAEEDMFRRTSTEHAPWYRVDANDKRQASLNVIRFVLDRLDYPEKETLLLEREADVVKAVSGGTP